MFEMKSCSVCGKNAGRLMPVKILDGVLCSECRKKIPKHLGKPDRWPVQGCREYFQYTAQNAEKYRKIFKVMHRFGRLSVDIDHGLFRIKAKGLFSGKCDIFELSQLNSYELRFDHGREINGTFIKTVDGSEYFSFGLDYPGIYCHDLLIKDNATARVHIGLLTNVAEIDTPMDMGGVKGVFDSVIYRENQRIMDENEAIRTSEEREQFKEQCLAARNILGIPEQETITKENLESYKNRALGQAMNTQGEGMADMYIAAYQILQKMLEEQS